MVTFFDCLQFLNGYIFCLKHIYINGLASFLMDKHHCRFQRCSFKQKCKKFLHKICFSSFKTVFHALCIETHHVVPNDKIFGNIPHSNHLSIYLEHREMLYDSSILCGKCTASKAFYFL